jgi:Ca2+-transporting ATPase
MTTPDAPLQAAAAWHALDEETTLSELDSDRERGLSQAEARARLERYGSNVLEKRADNGWIELLVRQIHNPIVYLLLGSTGLAMLMGKWLDGAVVLAAVLLNAAIGFIQEFRAGKAVEALAQMVPNRAIVLRDGRQVSLASSELVPGDVLLVSSGDRIPADGRLLESRNLRIDEAALTGESVPAGKRTGTLPEQTSLGDRTNMVFSGSLVTSGTGRVLIVSTGVTTELGRITGLLEQVVSLETPLTRAIAGVGRTLTWAVLAIAGALWIIGVLRGYSIPDATLAAITLAVAAIPEGLPAIITIALAIGVRRMARRGAVVRRLPSVETLGSTTVVCSDKTGTLTRNEMTVQALETLGRSYAVSGVGYSPQGVIQPQPAGGAPDSGERGSGEHGSAGLRGLLEAGALASDASLREVGGSVEIVGDPTEGALVVVAEKAGIDVEALRRAWPRVDVLPFESERQFMASLHARPGEPARLLIKGAPEVVLARTELDAEQRSRVEARARELAGRGLRVLAVASKELSEGKRELELSELQAGFALLGLQGMMDPPRPEAIAAIEDCRRGGISVKMITGDHLGTAEAIGRQLGLLGPAERGLPGVQIERLDAAELQRAALETAVFARVAPEHKLRLVEALQASGHVVAMTGDGANDAPALERAQIGIAMGITGTAAAKEAASMVLTDDNFATIARAVEEGRRISDNLVKALAFVLPTNLGLGLILMAAVAFLPIVDTAEGLAPLMPLLPTQLLWINLVASVALSLPLAFEVPERDVMRRPPRAPDSPLLDRFVILRTVLVALLMATGAISLFSWEYWSEVERQGHAVALAEAQTMTVTAVVLFQIFYLLNCRSLRASAFELGFFSNRSAFAGIFVLLLLQAAFIYWAPLRSIFGAAPIDGRALARAAAVAFAIWPLISLEKAWRRRGRRCSAAMPVR